jgi:hypothetical protein
MNFVHPETMKMPPYRPFFLAKTLRRQEFVRCAAFAFFAALRETIPVPSG